MGRHLYPVSAKAFYVDIAPAAFLKFITNRNEYRFNKFIQIELYHKGISW